jgi:hypothetical protein
MRPTGPAAATSSDRPAGPAAATSSDRPATPGRARIGPPPTTDGSPTVAEELERRRLERRVARMRLVVRELRVRARFHEQRHGAVPPPLRHAIAGFAGELRALERRLEELSGNVPRPRRFTHRSEFGA